MNWRTGAIAREAWLNVASSRWRTGGLVLAVAAILGALAMLELRDAHDLRSFQANFVRSGGYVALGIPAGGDDVSAARCEALNGQAGVVAAGGVFTASLAMFATAPGVLFQRAPITKGILRVWDPGAPPLKLESRGLVVGLALAEETGLRVGSHAVPAGEPAALVTAVVDTARRNPQVLRWALDPSPPTGAIEQCWVEFEPGAFDAGLAALPAWFTTGDEEAVARPYIRGDEFTRDPAAEFAARPQRDGWPVAGAVIAGFVALTAWFRRSELGLYLAVGTRRSELLTLLSLETLVTLVAAFSLALAYAFAVDVALHHSPGWSEVVIVTRTTGSSVLLTLVAAPAAAMLLVRGSIADMLKDR